MKFYVIDKRPPDWDVRPITRFDECGTPAWGPALRCGECGERSTVTRNWLGPYQAELEVDGPAAADMAFAFGSGVLVSNRLKSVWEAQGMTGFAFFEQVQIVRVRCRRRPKEVPAYWYAPVVPSRDYVLDEPSGVEREEPVSCEACRWAPVTRHRRVVLDCCSYSGQDIFVPRNLPLFLASQRFADFVVENGFVGIWLVPAEDYYVDLKEYRRYPE